MAGIGHVWGTADELLHPRDRHGRFRTKWKMATATAKKILGFLDGFSPRMFQNDGQAAQYLFNSPTHRFEGVDVTRLAMDYDEANENLRTGQIDDTTKKFVDMMERHRTQLKDDVILSRTVGPEAFGLTPQQMGAEEGGLEDFTGKLIADRGYGASHIGGIIGGQSVGPGKITMRMAVPKGTSVVIPARNRDDRGIFLDRDQELRITKVQPDGAGGYYVLAVATPRTKGATPAPISSSPRGVGLTPDQREARITERATGYAHPPSELREIESANQRAATAQEAQRKLDEAKAAPDLRDRRLEPQQPAPQTSEQLPQGVEPRNEPVQAPTAPGEAPAPEAVSTVPTPEEFRTAVRDALLPAPSAGPRRQQWNSAYLGVAAGKKDPGDALRELETDIRVNKSTLEGNRSAGRVDEHLADDIKAQEQLADLIREKYNLGQKQEASIPSAPAPATPSAPAAPEAPAPTKAARKAVSSQGGTKAAGLTPEQRQAVVDRVARMKQEGKFNPDNPEHQRLQSLVDQIQGPAKKAVPKAAVKKAAPAAPKASEVPVKEAVPKAAPEAGKPSWGTIKSFGAKPGDIVMYHGSDRKGPKADGRLVRIESRAGMYDLMDPETGKLVNSGGSAHRAWLSPGGGVTKKAVPEAPGERPLEKNTIKELRDIASTEGVELKSKMLKADIVKEIQRSRDSKTAPTKPLERGDRVTAADEARLLRRDAEVSRERGAVEEAQRLEQEAKQVAKKAPAKKAVPSTGRPLAKNTVSELRQIAKREGVPGYGSKTRPALIEGIERMRAVGPIEPDSMVGRRNAAEDQGLGGEISELKLIALKENVELPRNAKKIDIIEAIQRSRRHREAESVPTVPAAEAATNTRQADINKAGSIATAASEVDEMLNNQADPDVIKRTITATAKRLGIPDETRDRWLEAADSPAFLTQLADEIAAQAGLDPIGKAGEVVPFDPAKHSGTGIKAGTPVEIIRRGYSLRRGDEDIRLFKPQVVEASPATVKAQKLVPEGSVPGPKAQVPIASTERKASFKEAWNSADIKAPGSAGRSLTEIRDDVSTGKITPEEGVRRLESEVSLNKDELADIDATLRGDMPAAERRKLIAQADALEEGIAAQEKASSFMRDHFKEEAPLTEKEVLQLELPTDVRDALGKITPEQLKDEVERQGLKRPKGETKDEVIQDIARQIAAKELEDRATKAAKKAAPKKAPPPALPQEKGKLDARILAEGLDLGPWADKYLENVQKDLDEGKKTPAAIGRALAQSAEGRRTMAVFEHGGWHARDGRLSPKEDADRENNLQRMRGEADQLDELAKRLQGTKRPSVKAAPAKKVAPAVKAAEAKADSLEGRLLQGALERLQGAKSEQQVRDAVAGLTFKELKELSGQHGVSTRSRDWIIQGLIDRYAGTSSGVKEHEDRVRAAYDAVRARQPGEWVMLSDLRQELGKDLTSPQVDEALRRLEQQQGVHITPQSNQKALSQADLDSAVRIGGQDKHAIRIEGTPAPVKRAAVTPIKKAAAPTPVDDTAVQRTIEDTFLDMVDRQATEGASANIVSLADLRDALGDQFPREQVDRVLHAMNRSRKAQLIGESNQKTLTQRQRDAGVHIGAKDRHLLMFMDARKEELRASRSESAPTQWRGIRDQVDELNVGEATPKRIGDLVADLSLEELRAWADSLGIPARVNTRSSLIQELIHRYSEETEGE